MITHQDISFHGGKYEVEWEKVYPETTSFYYNLLFNYWQGRIKSNNKLLKNSVHFCRTFKIFGGHPMIKPFHLCDNHGKNLIFKLLDEYEKT